MELGRGILESRVKIIVRGILSVLLFLAPSVVATVQAEEPVALEDLTVTGDKGATSLSGMGNRPLVEHPGAATIVSPEALDIGHFTDTVEALRSVPGVHVLSEYGRGLRPNIGIRGMNPTRSRNILLLADGIPIQPATYGDPSSYYNLPVEQVDHIEVIRGGSSVIYGPNTIGGVVNYVTRRPPMEREFRLRETIRQGGFYSTELSYGQTLDGMGVLMSYLNKEGETVRDNTDTEVHDTTLRLIFPAGNGGEMALRFNFYREISQTPGGISPAQFAADPNQSQRSHDWFLGRRGSFDMRLNLPLSGDLSSETLFYLNFFERNWFIANGSDSPTVTTNRQFLRDFFVVGIEPRIRFGKTVVGVKVHYEQQNDVRRQGTSGVDTRSGKTDREADLSTTAVAAYVETELNLDKNFTMIPGVRYERLDQKRNVGLRGTVSGIGGRAETSEVTWGLGLRYDMAGGAAYANVHRTFQPPTFNEAVDPTAATDQDLDAETGTNYELGIRGELGHQVHIDLAVFLIEFENQIVDVGGTDQNAGETEHYGFEGTFIVEPVEELSLDLNVTYLQTEAKTGANIGKSLPMAPELKLAWGGTYERALSGGKMANIRLEGLFTDEQFSDSANTVAESANGGTGQLESYVVWNLRAQYVAASWKVFAGVNNLLDEEYRERRQSFFGGIIPGGTQNVYGGMSLTF